MKNSVSRDGDKEYVHYMTIQMPSGELKKGSVDYTRHPHWLGLENSDLMKGARVLDIAANDGYWSFWSESKGASEVVAIDVDGYENYDWGHEIPKSFMKSNAHFQKDSTFGYLHREFGSNVVRQKKSVYELNPESDGEFDLVFNFGLLYHLRHPLLSLDRVRKVCRGAFILRTHTVRKSGFTKLPVMCFYEDDVFKAVTNWTGPTEACCVQWMKNAGFKHVFVESLEERFDDIGEIGQSFVGLVDDRWLETFKKAPKLQYCDRNYFDEIRENTKDLTSNRPMFVVPQIQSLVSSGLSMLKSKRDMFFKGQ